MSEISDAEVEAMAREISSHRGERPSHPDSGGVEAWEKYCSLARAVFSEAERLLALRHPSQEGDGWIEWTPNEDKARFPPIEVSTFVEVKFRGLSANGKAQAGTLDWWGNMKKPGLSEVIAYRIAPPHVGTAAR